MKTMKVCLVPALMFVAVSGLAAEKAPFTAVRTAELDTLFLNSNDILHKSDVFTLVRSPEASDADFRDLYWINLEAVTLSEMDLAYYGRIVEVKNKAYAVVQLDQDAAANLSQKLHEQGLPCGVMFRLFGDTVSLAAAAERPKPEPVVAVSDSLEVVKTMMAKVEADNIQATIEELSNIYSRHHRSDTGKTVAQLLGEKYQQFASGRSDVTVGTYSHGSNTPQDSLVVRIEGATRPDEIIVLGSHIDSISYEGEEAPGADDNASGTAINLEIFRVVMEQGLRFDRTIEIHGYAAEEIGLVGSQNIAQQYAKDNKQVVAMVQHDMALYKKSGEDMIWFIENVTNADLNKSLQTLTDSYVGVKWSTGRLFGGTSDHESWHRQGFAAAFPFENPSSYNRKIHTAADTTEHANAFSQTAAFAKLGVAFLGHFAGAK